MTHDDTVAEPNARAGTECSYEAFGRQFFEHAVTRERVEAALADLTGNTFDFGPRNIGPGGFGRVVAEGQVGDVRVSPARG